MTRITESRDESELADNFGVSRHEDDQPTDPPALAATGAAGPLGIKKGSPPMRDNQNEPSESGVAF